MTSGIENMVKASMAYSAAIPKFSKLAELREAARYNAAVVRGLGDVLYYCTARDDSQARGLVAALDAAIAVQIFLSETIGQLSDDTTKK